MPSAIARYVKAERDKPRDLRLFTSVVYRSLLPLERDAGGSLPDYIIAGLIAEFAIINRRGHAATIAQFRAEWAKTKASKGAAKQDRSARSEAKSEWTSALGGRISNDEVARPEEPNIAAAIADKASIRAPPGDDGDVSIKRLVNSVFKDHLSNFPRMPEPSADRRRKNDHRR